MTHSFIDICSRCHCRLLMQAKEAVTPGASRFWKARWNAEWCGGVCHWGEMDYLDVPVQHAVGVHVVQPLQNIQCYGGHHFLLQALHQTHPLCDRYTPSAAVTILLAVQQSLIGSPALPKMHWRSAPADQTAL